MSVLPPHIVTSISCLPQGLFRHIYCAPPKHPFLRQKKTNASRCGLHLQILQSRQLERIRRNMTDLVGRQRQRQQCVHSGKHLDGDCLNRVAIQVENLKSPQGSENGAIDGHDAIVAQVSFYLKFAFISNIII